MRTGKVGILFTRMKCYGDGASVPGMIDRLLNKLMEDGMDPDDLFGEDGSLKRMRH